MRILLLQTFQQPLIPVLSIVKIIGTKDKFHLVENNTHVYNLCSRNVWYVSKSFCMYYL